MQSNVYVIGLDGSAPVKIGVSVNPAERLKTLQTGAPGRLAILWTTPGDRALEQRLHAHFRAYRAYGEWFDLAPLGDPVAAIREAVAALREGDVAPLPQQRTEAVRPEAGGACCPRWECDGRFGERCATTGADMSHRRPLDVDQAMSLLLSTVDQAERPTVYEARMATAAELEAAGIHNSYGAAFPVLIATTAERGERGRVVITRTPHFGWQPEAG